MIHRKESIGNDLSDRFSRVNDTGCFLNAICICKKVRGILVGCKVNLAGEVIMKLYQRDKISSLYNILRISKLLFSPG